MTSLLRVSAVLLIVSLGSCVTQEPRSTTTTRPSGVSLILTGELKDDPGQSINMELVRECEKQGLTRCRGWTAGSDKGQFKGGASIYIVAVLDGLKPNTMLHVEWKVYDPDGSLVKRQSLPTTVPVNWKIDESLNVFYKVVLFRSGKWKVELFVNGEAELSRTFDVT